MHRVLASASVLLFALGLACSREETAPEPPAPPPVSAEEARARAEEAYVFAYPMLEHLRSLLGMLRAEGTPLYVGGLDVFAHKTALLGPEVTQIVRPNNDTLYSLAILDLRGEPMLLGVPEVTDRYYSFQLIDLYTHNIGYVGTRATGTKAGRYLVAGPGWTGDAPDDVDGVIRSESNLVVVVGRTEVRGAADVAAVEAVQAGFSLKALGDFPDEPPMPGVPDYAFPEFSQERADGPEFLDYLAFLVEQVEVHESEAAMLAGFLALRAQLDDPAIRAAVQEGIEAARARIDAAVGELGEERNGWGLVLGLFGDRKEMQGQYLTRAAAARFGLWGNDEEEAYYPTAFRDGSGAALDGSATRYELRFAKDELPDVEGFWSATMYELPSQHMVANAIDRYSIGDRTEGLVYGEDGSLTLYLRADDPGAEKRTNWLPAPKGPFSVTLRMYVPSKKALSGPYAPPPIQPAE